jgi:Ca2+-binding RTX toxin-like protein
MTFAWTHDAAVAHGGAGNDSLSGSEVGDAMHGGTGNDFLTGRGGSDTLYGDSGADRFVFGHHEDANGDHIIDFSRAEGDRIDLSEMDANTLTPDWVGGANDAFIVVDGFTGVAGQLVISAPTNGAPANEYTVRGDVNGDGIADFAIAVTSVGGAPLPADFIL